MKKCIRILLTFCIIFGLLSGTVYAAEQEKPFDYKDEDIIATVQGILTEVNAFSDDELDYYMQNSLGITKSVCEEYRELKRNDTLGEFVEFKDSKIENTENSVIVTVTAAYKKEMLTLTATYKQIGTQIVPTEVNLKTGDALGTTSKLEAIKNAGLNTLMGITIVVLILLFISFLISLFKYIPALQDKFAGKKEVKPESVMAVDNAVAQIAQREEELTDDTELIAVITAAICAATGSSGDSFVVRSVRKTRFK